jgi:hypothetical protein
MSSPGLAQFKLSFELSPIILTNGIAKNVPGGMMPIISLTEAQNFDTGLLSGSAGPDLDNFFANFIPLPNATLIDQDIGMYPFANQAVAANAVIAKPLAISYRMICPVRQAGGYSAKLAVMMALQASLQQHNNSGGTYTLVTPSYIYVNCLMTSMRDISPLGDTAQKQTEWQLDFVKPLLTLDDAEQAQNSLMSKFTSGTQINGDPAWSGLPPTVGDPSSLAGPSIVPPASDLFGSGASGPGI